MGVDYVAILISIESYSFVSTDRWTKIYGFQITYKGPSEQVFTVT